MSNYLVTDTDMTSVADAIRTKGGTSASLAFPTGFVNAINDIQSGGGGSAKTVTITLDNPNSPEGFGSFTIYEETDGVKGSLIGSIPSPTGSTTVTVSASANGLRCELSGAYVFVNADSLAYSVISGNIGLKYYADGDYISYVVAGDGAIQIDWIEWAD